MKTIVVTGGAGFLGSHLCEYLLNQGHNVVCVDNFFTGNMDNILHLKENKRFEVIRHDITEPLQIFCHEIYNLACPASPIHYQHNPVETWKTSIIGSFRMLEMARRNDAKILQASTSEVYGNPTEHPQKEEYWGNVNTLGIRACYDEGKRAAETIMMDFHRKYGTNIRIVRIFNTYGPRMAVNDGRVVSNFIIQALKGKNITIYGDGLQTRSFCYVSDLIEGIVRKMNQNQDYGPTNIGNPKERTIKELAEKIIHLTGTTAKIIYENLPQDDPVRRKPDINKAKRILDWEPKVRIEDGLNETIEYFKSVLNL
jgi:UDP-glucuronate decarboxylase